MRVERAKGLVTSKRGMKTGGDAKSTEGGTEALRSSMIDQEDPRSHPVNEKGEDR